ncbi:hypothetical protein GTHT12_03739 (plasmid) [Geobacillus thermodenitrificans]|uniref:hypothetical protein n=1 Tax=Geobacillus thermodenitrificans TaxID=33940 RepID=UPI000A28FF90|nr:hypothetical protein [Geobacillus thermodenitrificans]ARP44606.1 hypothetical protein GTHT12_03739 [Geobacillus thermodenitrificans]
MDWKEVKLFTSAGQAFVPVNVEGRGDSVKLLFRNGETKQLDMQCSSFLKQLLMFFGTSVSINRHRYGELVGKKQLVPMCCRMALRLFRFMSGNRLGGKAVWDGSCLGKLSDFSNDRISLQWFICPLDIKFPCFIHANSA